MLARWLTADWSLVLLQLHPQEELVHLQPSDVWPEHLVGLLHPGLPGVGRVTLDLDQVEMVDSSTSTSFVLHWRHFEDADLLSLGHYGDLRGFSLDLEMS